MSQPPPPSGPLRTVVAVLLLWVLARSAALWWSNEEQSTIAVAGSVASAPPQRLSLASNAVEVGPRTGAISERLLVDKVDREPRGGVVTLDRSTPVLSARLSHRPSPIEVASAVILAPLPSPSRHETAQTLEPSGPPSVARPSGVPPDRWRGSAALFVRGGGAASTFAPALGGSQTSVEAAYRLAPGVEAVARVTADRLGGEAALGVVARIGTTPLRAALWRRQGLGDGARDATLALLSAGREGRAGPLHVESYATIGARIGVGAPLRDPELFAESMAAARLRMGHVTIGPAAWAAAQRDVRRVDVGLSLSAPVGRNRLRLDWRERVSGNAAPASGPAVTLAIEF